MVSRQVLDVIETCLDDSVYGEGVIHVGPLPGLPQGGDLGPWDCLNITVGWGRVVPRPTHQVLHVRQGGVGKDHLLPGHVVHWVGDVTEVPHGCHVPYLDTLIGVVISRGVLVVDLEEPVPATADNAVPRPTQAAHHLRHLYPVVGGGGHLVLTQRGKCHPTVRQIQSSRF